MEQLCLRTVNTFCPLTRLYSAPYLHTVAPSLVDAPERYRPKRELPGLPFGMTVIDVTLVPRRPDAR